MTRVGQTVDVPRLRLRSASKTYGATRALVDVDLEIEPGEVHCLLGQNGSGKSTLAKILSGYHAPDRGASLEIDGEPVRLPVRPADLHRLGVAIVHQSLGLVDQQTVLENIRIGRFTSRRWSRRIDWRAETAAATVALEAVGAAAYLHIPVGSLSAADRARVAIARAIQSRVPGRGLVIFDESSRALPRHALETFYGLIQSLVEDGASVLMISHSLDEVIRIGDRVTVLRDGRVIETGVSVRGLSERHLVHMMLGRTLETLPLPSQPRERAPGVQLRGLRGGHVRELSLDIGRGEIIGLTGLTGSGCEDVPYLLSGYLPATAGTLDIGGESITLESAGVKRLLDAGVALVPERRDQHGLAYGLTIQENVTLPLVPSRGSAFYLGRGWQVAEASDIVQRLGVTPPFIDRPVAQLSGGNQQKVLMGKWLATDPELLLLHEPTQGVDVGARADILRLIRQAADAGRSTLIVATEQDDLSVLCDRVVVMRNGVPERTLSAPVTIDDIAGAIYLERGGELPRVGGGARQ